VVSKTACAQQFASHLGQTARQFQGALVRFAWGPLAAPLRLILRKSNTIEDAGRTLSELALAKTRPPDGRVYAALRRGQLTWPEPSELARRDDLMVSVWNDSAELVGLSA
jgi:hypothetical protein